MTHMQPLPHQFLAAILCCGLSFSSISVAAEPTNAAEAAAQEAAATKKSADLKIIDDKYAAWKSTLTPERQAWEDTLAVHLGNFYLPAHKKSKVANPKAQSAWDFVEDNAALPRVLLIGDSISRAYTVSVRQALAGKANIHRAPTNCGPTSTGEKKIDEWLGTGHWDLIHVNFGIHDRKTPIPEYAARLEKIITRLKKTGAVIVWASSTPVGSTDAAPLPETAIPERNAAAAEIMTRHHIPINDLYTFITPFVAKNRVADACHYNAEGAELLGKQVAMEIEKNLPNATKK